MPWKTINRIIGLASINPAFRQQLQQDPLAALEVQGFELTPEEQEVFTTFCSLPFPLFCQHLQAKLAPDE